MIIRKFTRLLFLNCLIAQCVLLGDFPKPTNTQKTDLTLPDPEEAVAGMSLPDGFEINCFASEPMIRQPIAMTTTVTGYGWRSAILMPRHERIST